VDGKKTGLHLVSLKHRGYLSSVTFDVCICNNTKLENPKFPFSHSAKYEQQLFVCQGSQEKVSWHCQANSGQGALTTPCLLQLILKSMPVSDPPHLNHHCPPVANQHRGDGGCCRIKPSLEKCSLEPRLRIQEYQETSVDIPVSIVTYCEMSSLRE
jgi:hypothetical protein